MTHRCCECGSDNCCCPATPEEIEQNKLREKERFKRAALESLTVEEMEAEIKTRKRMALEKKRLEIESELKELG